MCKWLKDLRNKIPIYFGINALIHSTDVGYSGVYLWCGKYAICFGGYNDPDVQWYTVEDCNYYYGIYIKLGKFEYSNWDIEDGADLP